MASANTLIPLVIGAALLAGVMQFSIPTAAWIALALLLHASRAMPAASGGMVLLLALYGALVLGYRGLLPVQGAAYFGITAFMTATVALPFVIDRLVAARTGTLGSILVFPLTLVAVEFLRSRLPPATWFSMAYTQYGNLPLMQVAAFVGIWGITFLLGWFASTVEWIWIRHFTWSGAGTPALIFVLVAGLVAIGGSLRVALAPTDRPSLRAVTLNRPVDLFIPGEMTQIVKGRLSAEERGRFAEKLARLQDWFLEGSRREARAGAKLVAWPEQNLLVFAEDETAFIARARELAASEHVYLVMGMGTVHVGDPRPFENKSILIDPSGRVLVSYLKTHPVAGFETSVMRPGDGRLPVVDTRDGRMATAICFDADFPEFMRQAGLGGAELLIVPANEWPAIKYLHAHMAAFRAIENGAALVRPAASGIATAVDPWGRVIGTSDYFAAGDRTMTAQVPVGHFPTLYAITGDLFAWLCVAGALVTAGAAFIPGR